MKKFLINTILFSACVIGIGIALVIIPDTELLVGTKKIYLEKNPDKNYDLMVLGSSRAQHTFSPGVYTGDLRIFNMGEDGHGFPSNYLMLKTLVDKHDLKIRNVLFQVDEFSFKGERELTRQFRDDYFLTEIDDPEVFEAFKKYRGPLFANVIKLFPKLGNLVYCDFYKVIRNEILSLKTIVPSINKKYQNRLSKAALLNGYIPLDTFAHIKLAPSNKYFDLEEDDVEYFKKLVAFCKAHNIGLFLFRAPIWKCEMVKSEAFDQYIKTFTEDNDIKFFDYKCKYQWPGFYMDQNHSASAISEQVSKDLLRDMNMIK